MIGFFGCEDLEEDDSVDNSPMCGFKPQKEIICNKLLPYADQLDNESNEIFSDIKINLSRAILLREIHPGCKIWTSRLKDYIKLYGLKFSKEDHVALVNLLYDVVIIPDLDLFSVCNFANVLIILLKKKYLLSPDDVVLPWRPLYELCTKILPKRNHVGVYVYCSSLQSTLRSFIHLARTYFPETATQEILDELKPKLCPVNCSQETLQYLEWFLPISLPPEKAHLGYKLWLTDIMDLWATCNNMPVWEANLMRLLANLAKENIGYIDWEPYIPMMFTRFLRAFDFPVAYKQHRAPVRFRIDMGPVALWIVSVLGKNNSCQYYLDRILKTIESYYHPANYGVWFSKLKNFLFKLPDYFIQRVHYERFKNLRWQTPVPSSHTLTEEDIDKFVESMKGIALQALYSKMGCASASMALKHLATLRPKIIIPALLERLYSTIESVTEPHKFTSLMSCMSMVARPLIDGPSNGYPEGRTHVIPLLLSTLPGIDANDFKKSYITIQFILIYVTLVPLIDSSEASQYWSDLTEEEKIICAATANFEDFVAQFFDRIFVFVENSSLESTRSGKSSSTRSPIQTLPERALSPVCAIVLSQCSTAIFKSALKKLVAFATERIMETQSAGRIIASLCAAFSSVNPEETLKCLLPHLCGRILSLTESEEVRKEETLDDELHYNLVLLESIEYCSSAALTYLSDILPVLDRVLSLSSREGVKIGSTVLQRVLQSLTTIVPLENRSLSHSYDIHVKDYLPVRDWGKAYNLEELNLQWYVPGEKEISAAEAIVLKYLPLELKKLENHITDEAPLTRDELLKSFDIILGTLSALPVMPLWDEEPLALIDSALKPVPMNITLGIKGAIKMPNGGNVRSAIFEILNKLQKKLLTCGEDDTKSLLSIISIWESLLLNKNVSVYSSSTQWEGFSMRKRILGNPLIGKKCHLRRLLIDRVIAQMEVRAEKAITSLTKTHELIMLNLLELSCSHYSEVRKKAQCALSRVSSHFLHSYRILLPKLLENLQLDPTENHERFKGSLYVLFVQKEKPIATRHDWDVLLKIWPALVKSKPSEKISVVKLLDWMVEDVFKHFAPLPLKYEIPESCIEKAKVFLGSSLAITDMEIENGLRTFKERCKKDNESYLELLNSLMDAIQEKNLHWRYYSMALYLTKYLAHPNVPYPARVVKTFLYSLINDSIELRKMAIKTVVFILRQQRREQKTIVVDVENIAGCPVPKKPSPGIRPDNLWLQYNSSKVPKTQDDWDAARYCHKRAFGYYQWPRKLELNAPTSEQPPVDELKPENKEIRDFFSNANNVSQLIKYLSLEDKKGEDKFNMTRFLLFKRLFKNHEDSFFDVFKPHLEKLVVDKQESSQRCAAEIVAGVIRGSKHWSYEKNSSLWDFLGPLIRTALSNMTEETVSDWGLCFATAAKNKDPNKNYWLFELLMEDPLREKFSLLGCARLFVLQDALIQQGWRMSELLQRLLEYTVPFLGHPFQNVREMIASVLTDIFEPDVKLPGGNTLGPHPEELLTAVVPKLNSLYSLIPSNGFPECAKDTHHMTHLSEMLDSISLHRGEGRNDTSDSLDKKAVIGLLKTTCMWIIFTFKKSPRCMIPEFYSIFPLICSLESYDQDEELVTLCSQTLSAFAQGAIAPEHIPIVFESVWKVATMGSWGARSSVVVFLQVFIFRNMSLILSNSDWTTKTTDIVLKLLEDERVEVREKAGQVLGGLLHCDIISNSEELLENFKAKAKSKSKKLASENADILRKRHSGILGLCAFINSSPYDVPDCVPEIFYILGSHWNDPEPIPTTIRKTLNDFKRTHHDNWEWHQLKFTQTQLDVLNDLNVPSYCA